MLDDQARIKYFRRRQFVLGPRKIDYPGWNHFRLSNGYQLSYHPDLPFHHLSRKGQELILLGYWVDPYEPELDDQTILARLGESCINLNSVIRFIEHLTGRFVLLVCLNNDFYLFHDACGLRNVVYGADDRSQIWCASQPEFLAEQVNSPKDTKVLDFLNLRVFRENKLDYYFPFNKTVYKNIFCLLANHFLDLKSGKPVRFWPSKTEFAPMEMEKTIPLIARLLAGSLKAAARRFNLKIGLSAGLDSRIILAASKKITGHVTFFTHTPTNQNLVDMEVPKRLASRLKLNYEFCEIFPISEEFKNIFLKNNSCPILRRGNIAFSVLKKFGPEATIGNGNIYEFSRLLFWVPDFLVSGSTLAIMSSLDHPLARAEFQNWLDEARPSILLSRIHPTILFELEIVSRWVAEAYLDYDFAHEIFNPFNNRLLIKLVNSVNSRFRRGNYNIFDYRLIEYLWPEVLVEPVNPARDLKGTMKRTLFLLVNRYISPYVPLLEIGRFLKYCAIYKSYEGPFK